MAGVKLTGSTAPQQCLNRLPLPQLQGAFLEVINASALNQKLLQMRGSLPRRCSTARADSSQKRAVDSNEYAPAVGLNVGSLMLYGRLQSDSTQRIPRRRRSIGKGNLSRPVASKSKEAPQTQYAGGFRGHRSRPVVCVGAEAIEPRTPYLTRCNQAAGESTATRSRVKLAPVPEVGPCL